MRRSHKSTDHNQTRINLFFTTIYRLQRTVFKSNEDMILALAGQFKQLSHEPKRFR